jgi:hypothetical protein
MIPPTIDPEANTVTKSGARPVDSLMLLAQAAHAFRSPDGRFHVQVPLNERHDVLALRSRAFRNWLVDLYRTQHGEVPSTFAIGQVLGALEARARFDDNTQPVFVRVGRDGQGPFGAVDYYLDLANTKGQAVKISPQGWSIVQRPPVRFRRSDGMLALPTPAADGSIALLRQYVNLSDLEFCLLIGWMTAALLPIGPYPILVIHGEQGSAKSTLTRVARHLVDPHGSPLLAAPQSTRDLVVTAYNSWVLAFDNISKLPTRLADGLCRLATGGGVSNRRPFSSDGCDIVYAQRPVILNGIDDFIHRADLLERSMIVNTPPIIPNNRRRELEFWQSFEADYPAIFGGLLNAFTAGLRLLPSVEIAELPRMADFARLGEAVARGLGWPDGTFLTAYTENRRSAAVYSLEESVLARALLDAASLGGLLNYTKSATEMLEELSKGIARKDRASSRWPRSPRQFTDELRRIGPQLRMRGITVKFIRTPHARLITIHADRSFDHSVGPHYTESLKLPE